MKEKALEIASNVFVRLAPCVCTQSECQFLQLETTWKSINELEADKEFPEVVSCVLDKNQSKLQTSN